MHAHEPSMWACNASARACVRRLVIQQNAAECCKMQLQNHFRWRTLTGLLRLSQTSLLARTQTKHAGERGGFQGISFGVGGD
jgi:hypothetical protein